MGTNDDGISIAAGRSAKFVATLLAALPPTWQIWGEGDGTLSASPRRKPADDEDTGEDVDG